MGGASGALKEVLYQPRGAAEQLWYCHDPEVCMAGPANTGKTRGHCERLVWEAEEYKGYRALIIRLCRAHLTESAVRTMEDLVLWPGHPALRGASRENRRSYTFPNGSAIVLGGLDEPTKWYSTEWDVVYCNEASELSLDQYERFHRALRNKHMPHPHGNPMPEYLRRDGEIDLDRLRADYEAGRFEQWDGNWPDGSPMWFHQLRSDTNPDAPTHWLRQRMDSGKCTELICRHSDNPTFGANDQAALDALTGVRRARLRDGLWVAAEGQIWDLFDATAGEMRDGRWVGGHIVDDIPRDRNGRPVFEFYVFSQDWGYRKPGCLGIWGVMPGGDMYLEREWYRQGKAIDWWLSVAVEANQQYKPIACVCDPEDAGAVELYRRAGIPTQIADKRDKRASLGQVSDRMARGRNGRPRIFFLRTALVEKDPELVATYQPTCTVEEIPAYVWRRTKDGQVVKEEPDPLCVDHGCDQTRYCVRFVDRHFPSAAIKRSDAIDEAEKQGPRTDDEEVPYELRVLGRTDAKEGGAEIQWPWRSA